MMGLVDEVESGSFDGFRLRHLPELFVIAWVLHFYFLDRFACWIKEKVGGIRVW